MDTKEFLTKAKELADQIDALKSHIQELSWEVGQIQNEQRKLIVQFKDLDEEELDKILSTNLTMERPIFYCLKEKRFFRIYSHAVGTQSAGTIYFLPVKVVGLEK